MDDAERHRLAATFDGAAALYDRARPGVPDAVLDWVLPPGARQVVDLGAGTGQLTRSLVARGLDVVAVDTSAAALALLRRALPGVVAVRARAELTGLRTGAFDAALAAAAFHWFDRPAADAEIARLLRPGGVVGLQWNQRGPGMPLAAEVDDILGHHEPTTPGSEDEVVLDRRWFGPSERREFAHAQRVTPDGFADLIGSVSYVLAMPNGQRADVRRRVRAAAARVAEDGAFDLPYLAVTVRAVRS